MINSPANFLLGLYRGEPLLSARPTLSSGGIIKKADHSGFVRVFFLFIFTMAINVFGGKLLNLNP